VEAEAINLRVEKQAKVNIADLLILYILFRVAAFEEPSPNLNHLKLILQWIHMFRQNFMFSF